MDQRHRTYPLRLCPSMRERVEAVAKQDQVSVNHFISLAIAEKLTRMEQDVWMRTKPAIHPPAPQHGYGNRLH